MSRAEIERSNKAFVDALARGDASSIAQMYTADGKVLPPGMPMQEGPAAIEVFWKGAIASGVRSAKLDTLSFEQYGDTGIEVGRYTLQIDAGGQQTTDRGKYVVVWKKDGGSWKLAVDIYNSDGT